MQWNTSLQAHAGVKIFLDFFNPLAGYSHIKYRLPFMTRDKTQWKKEKCHWIRKKCGNEGISCTVDNTV